MDFAQRLAVHLPGHLGEPVVNAGQQCKDFAAHEGVVEVAHHPVSVVQMEVGGGVGVEDTGQAADGEVEDHPQREEHRRIQPHLPLPDGGQRGEEDDAGGDGDQLGGGHERRGEIVRHATGEHVVRPHDSALADDEHQRAHRPLVAEQRLAGEVSHDLQHEGKGRDDHHVHRRVGVSPEDVLIQHRRAAAGRPEEGHARHPIQHRHDQRRGHELGENQAEHRGAKDAPDEDRQPPPGHPRRAQADDGDQKVEAAEDGRQAEGDEGQQEEQHGRAAPLGQRRIHRPAGSVAAGQQRGDHQRQRHRRGEPVTQRVQAREGHVFRANEQGHGPVPQPADEHGHRHGDHDDAVHGHHRVVRLRPHDRPARVHQLDAHEHRQQAGDEKQSDKRDQILNSDHFVVGGKRKVAPEAVRLLRRSRFVLQTKPPPRPVVPDSGAEQPADQKDKVADRDRHFGGQRLAERHHQAASDNKADDPEDQSFNP